MNNSISEMTRIWQQVLKLVDARLQERQIFDSFFADTYINDIKGSPEGLFQSRPVAFEAASGPYRTTFRDI